MSVVSAPRMRWHGLLAAACGLAAACDQPLRSPAGGREGMLAFSDKVPSPLPAFGDSLVAGDWDRDGRPDVAAGSHAGALNVLLNSSGGLFARATTYAARGSITALAAGDLDGDGDLDLALAQPGQNAVALLFGRGDGSFSGPAPVAAGLSPSSIVAADFDGDRRADLAVGAAASSELLILASASGQAARRYPTPAPAALASADLDGDGRLDLVVGGQLGARGVIDIFLGAGDGSFSAGTRYEVGASPLASLAAADLDGDQRVDLAVATGPTGIRLFFGKGDGTFRTGGRVQASERLSEARQVVLADLDGDRRADLAVLLVPAAGPALLSVLVNRGGGGFASPVLLGELTPGGVGRASLATSDLDGDGRLDLVASDGQQVAAFLNQSR